MNNHNGHKNGVNPHDAIAARIVAGAMQAQKLPPAAARAVFRAMGAANALPDQPAAAVDVPGESVPTLAVGIEPAQDTTELTAAAGGVIATHHDGILRAVLAAKGIDTTEPQILMEVGDLNGFTYEDGRTEFELHGKPLVMFWPPEVAFEEGFMLVNQRYRMAV